MNRRRTLVTALLLVLFFVSFGFISAGANEPAVPPMEPATQSIEQAAAEVDVNSTEYAGMYARTTLTNYDNANGIRFRTKHCDLSIYDASSNWCASISSVLEPGTSIEDDDNWKLSHAYVADNFYAQVNIVSLSDGKSRWYNVWGPYNITAEGKIKINVVDYRYSTTHHQHVVQIG